MTLLQFDRLILLVLLSLQLISASWVGVIELPVRSTPIYTEPWYAVPEVIVIEMLLGEVIVAGVMVTFKGVLKLSLYRSEYSLNPVEGLKVKEVNLPTPMRLLIAKRSFIVPFALNRFLNAVMESVVAVVVSLVTM